MTPADPSPTTGTNTLGPASFLAATVALAAMEYSFPDLPGDLPPLRDPDARAGAARATGPGQLSVHEGQVSAAQCPQLGQPAGGVGISPPASSSASGTWNCSRQASRSASLMGNV